MNASPLSVDHGLDIRALLTVIAGGTMISFSAVFVKLVSVGPSTSVFYRVFFGGLALMIIALIRKDSFRANREILLLIIAGGFFFALDLEVWHRAIIYIGPGLATIISNFQVFILAFLGVFIYGERLTVRLLLALPLAITGLWLLLGLDVDVLPEGTGKGVVLGLLTAVFYAIYLLILRKSQSTDRKLSLIMNMALISLTTSLFSASFGIFHDISFAIPTLADGGYLLGYGLLCQGVGWVLLSSALPKLPTSVAGLLLLTQPTLSFIWDILLFDRPTGPLGLLGACMTIFAIWAGISGQQAARKSLPNPAKRDKGPSLN